MNLTLRKESNISKTFDMILGKQLADFILSSRFCDKHFRQMLKKQKIIIKDAKKYNVAQLPGVCETCYKGGIVYYLINL
jgi:predicted metal-binding protein